MVILTVKSLLSESRQNTIGVENVGSSVVHSCRFVKKLDLKGLKSLLNNFYKLIAENVPALVYF
jgi:hypothetical protein